MKIRKAKPLIEMNVKEFEVIENFMGLANEEELAGYELVDILQEIWECSLNIRSEKKYSSSYFDIKIVD